MLLKRFVILLFSLVISFSQNQVRAQHSANDTILLGSYVVGKDTFGMVFLQDVDIIGQYLLAEERTRLNKLRYNVYRVYPYAITAAQLLKNVDDTLDKMDRRRERKTYLKSLEKEMDARFKNELKSLSVEQGQILVKLISRQTGHSCYHIIKELKGGFNAFVWQGVALVWNNNLKREYDPEDRDKDIEKFVLEIEAYNKYRYERYQQEQQRVLIQKQVQQYRASRNIN